MTHFALPILGAAEEMRRMADLKRVQGIARRRDALDALRAAGGAMPTAALAAAVGIEANALRVSHLPRLVRAGAVAWDRGVVRLARDVDDAGARA